MLAKDILQYGASTTYFQLEDGKTVKHLIGRDSGVRHSTYSRGSSPAPLVPWASDREADWVGGQNMKRCRKGQPH